MFERSTVRRCAPVAGAGAGVALQVRALSTDVRLHSRRTNIVTQGERSPGVFVVLEGWAARYNVLPGGARRITALLLPGDFCDPNYGAPGPMDHSVTALTECKLAHIDRDVLDEALGSAPHLARELRRSTLIEAATLRKWLVNMGLPAEPRLAHLVCELQMRMQAAGLVRGNSLHLPLTQEEMGDAIDATPVHANRVLRTLRERGLLTFLRGSLTIPNLSELQRACDFDPCYLQPEGAGLSSSRGTMLAA